MKKNVLIGISIIGTILCIILILGALSVLFLGQVRTFSSQMGDVSGSNEMMKSIDSNRFYETGSAGVADSAEAAASPSFQAMYFQNYGTNIFLDTKIDSLSTFAVDVDTASYSIVKNYIMRGQLPPTDAIRPEEFINYFDYGYKNPTSDFVPPHWAEIFTRDELHVLAAA